jgi:hypothetical protein
MEPSLGTATMGLLGVMQALTTTERGAQVAQLLLREHSPPHWQVSLGEMEVLAQLQMGEQGLLGLLATLSQMPVA